jgi:LacI family transcriptional regulator
MGGEPGVVTIREVAQASGVHISTVSRAFSAPHLVNFETRNRVLTVASDLGYRPNRAARGLITGRTHNLGLIVADIANPFFPPLIKAAQTQARERDYSVFVADTDESPLVEEHLVEAFAKQVDGVLLCSPRMSNRQIHRLRREVPLVVVNRHVKGLPTVLMDVGSAARQAIDHLTGLGHEHLALVAGPAASWTSGQIRRSASAAARAAGARLHIIGPNPPTSRGGAAAAEAVLSAGVTAVLAYNDLVAIGLMEALDQARVRVPADLSVVGIDDIPHSQLTRPKLTTVTMPTVAAGRIAVDMLLQLVADDGPASTPQTTLDTALVIRESTAPPSNGGRDVRRRRPAKDATGGRPPATAAAGH